MATDAMFDLLDRLEEQLGTLFELPLPLDSAEALSIHTTTDGTRYLRVTLVDGAPRAVRAIVEGVGEAEGALADPPINQVLMRTWLPTWFCLHAILGDDAPDAVLYRGVTGAPSGTDPSPAGAVIGQAAPQLDIAFLAQDGSGGWRYLDPAIVGRALASFSQAWQALVVEAIRQQPGASESFGFDRASTYLDTLAPGTPPWRVLIDAFRSEYQARVGVPGIPTSTTIDALYRLMVPPPSGVAITRAEFVRDFPAAVQASANRMAHFALSDQHLHCVVLEASQYEMDLIDAYDFGQGFLELTPLLGQFQLIVNGPTFDLGRCKAEEAGLPGPVAYAQKVRRYAVAQGANAVGVEYRGLTKGRLVFRSTGTVDGVCPISRDPAASGGWRFHFGQRVTGEYELAPNLIGEAHDFASAFENVTGVYLQGLRVGVGHDIETQREEPDNPYGDLDKFPLIDGLPILGRCARGGIEYLFVVMRPDQYSEMPNTPGWEEVLSLLEEMGVIDAFITDGDDSVGLLIENQGAVLEPGAKKDGQIALAIGFRRT